MGDTLDLVLASASPRRKRLLEEAGLRFRIVPADVDETIDAALDAGAASEDLALRKARAVAERLAAESLSGGALRIVGSDTLVVLGDDGDPARAYLEKAADEAEARSMLQRLSGTRHRVITGVAVLVLEGGEIVGAHTGHGVTFVSMRELTDEELEGYVASGEWRDKAGAYAIQETADRFVTGLEGAGIDNVVGLPVALTLDLLARARD